jgi:hypothetical protein
LNTFVVHCQKGHCPTIDHVDSEDNGNPKWLLVVAKLTIKKLTMKNVTNLEKLTTKNVGTKSWWLQKTHI